MRILLVQTTDWFKRFPAQQHHLMELLSLRGHEIRAIDFELLWKDENNVGFLSKKRIIQDYSKIYNGAKVTIVRPPFIKCPVLDYLSIFFSDMIEIRRQVKEFKPDIIVSFGVIAFIAGLVAKENGLPFVYYWIDVTHRLIPVKALQPIGWAFERAALKLADVILTINVKLKEYVVNMGADPSKTIVLGAGIDLARFDASIDGSKVRALYGIGNEDLVLFFMGWLYNFSGLKEVATEICKTSDNRLKLFIIGDGDLFNELKQIKESHDVKNKIILAGRKSYSEIPSLIASANICLLPSYSGEKIMLDIVPIKLYEYMAMGKPIISTKLPGVMKEFGENSGISYVDRPEEVLSRAIELERLFKTGSLDEVRARLREFAEKRSWNCITDNFEEVLDKLV